MSAKLNARFAVRMPGSAKLDSIPVQLCAISGHGIVSGGNGFRQCTVYGPVDPWIEAITIWLRDWPSAP